MLTRLLSLSLFLLLASAATNETDQEALLQIKDLISEDPLGVLSSWNRSLHFCHWHGVRCSRRHQRVAVLDLSALKLEGSVSPHIGNLTFLRAIFLENNSFHGTIPEEISRLLHLRYLLLQDNAFQGEFSTNLSLTNVTVINLERNNLAGKLPWGLGYLPNLSVLRLSSNHFTGLIPPSVGNLSSLQTLTLNRNNLDGNIPFELGRLSNLVILQLSTNNLSGMVPLTLFNISTMTYFELTLNKFNGSLPPDLGVTLPNLRGFYGGGNKFSGPFPTSLANASKLVDFDIPQNSLTGTLPTNLGSLRHLQLFQVSVNHFGSNKSNDLSFLNSLSNCTSLQILEFSENSFGGVLPSSIANFSTKLVSLRLDKNYISGNIPQEFGNLYNLGALYLSENMLEGSIPQSIGKLSNLQGLRIYKCSISGQIPLSIGNMTRLSVLDLGGNMLQGSIPVTLSNISSLEELNLGDNLLSGTIPEQVFGLSSLIILYLHQNHLTGQLPHQVGSLKNIGKFTIAANKLTGEIPKSLGDCVVLELLYMQDNLFEGTIPSSFKQLKGIQDLFMSYNNLSGHIPSFLGELPFIKNLILSHNMFEGEVPTNGVFRNITAFSVVGNVKLCGGIQALELPTCSQEIPENKNKAVLIRRILIPLGIIIPVFLLLACLWAILSRIRGSTKEIPSELSLQIQHLKLSYAELFQATDGFCSTNLIGEGSFSSVYQGNLDSANKIVAIKVLNLQKPGARSSFLAECEALRNLRHRNLVKIITSCSSIDLKGSEFKALVFEYMPNGTLHNWLHPSSSEQQQNGDSLNLVQRLSIAIDVASALDYLQHQCETPIAHCDIKPSNILLDKELCAYIGDFGLATVCSTTTAQSNHLQTCSIGIKGTIGYVAPEYGMGGEATVQGDVYSYGILLLEMFTGKGPTNSMFTVNSSLHNYVQTTLTDQVLQIVDPQIRLQMEDENETKANCKYSVSTLENGLRSLFQVGLLCSAESPKERMDIRDVIVELHAVRGALLRA